MTNEPQIPPDVNSKATGQVDPANPIKSPGRWSRRNLMIAGLFVAVVLCLAGARVATTYFALDAARDAIPKPVPVLSAEDRVAEAFAARSAAEEVRQIEFQNWKVAEDARVRREQHRRRETDESARNDRRRRYVDDLHHVQVAWEQGQVGTVLDLLDAHRPAPAPGSTRGSAAGPITAPEPEDLRGFEWYYWNRRCQIARLRVSSAEDQARGGAADADESQFASESYKETIKLRDAGKLRNAARPDEIRTLTGHAGSVVSLAFSPDGTRVISAGRDKSVKVWDAARGEQILNLPGNADEVLNVAFSPDGTRIATSAADRMVKVLDANSGNEIVALMGHTDVVNGIAFSLDGKRIASASNDQTVKIWDAVAGQELLTLKGHLSEVLCVAFSPDQTRVASGGTDGTVKIWDAPRDDVARDK